MSTAHFLGQPELEQAEDGIVVLEDQNNERNSQDAQNAADWRSVADLHWATAYIALSRREYRQMHESAEQAKQAEKHSDAVLTAIFGGAPTPATDLVAKGQRLDSALVQRARKEVLSEVRAYEKRTQARRDRQNAERKQRQRKAHDAQANSGLRSIAPIGSTWVVTSVDGSFVNCADLFMPVRVAGVSVGDTITITSHLSKWVKANAFQSTGLEGEKK